MNPTPSPAAPRKKQSVAARLLLFFAGAGVNYLLISTPLEYLRNHYPSLPDMVNAGLSLGVSATFFFFWNYFVNFRTGSRKRDALARYVVAAAGLWALSSLTLGLFNHIDLHPHIYLDLRHFIGVRPFNINRDVVATQFFLGGFKFLIYHYWAFPAHKEK
jgi:hypothetical protein